MKQYFTLACRITGLLIFGYAVLTALTVIPMFFLRPETSQIIPQLPEMPDSLRQQLIQSVDKSSAYLWTHLLTSLVFTSVLPMFFGLYLMKSGRWFIDFCYPEQQTIHTTPGFAPPTSPAIPQTAKKQDDRKYMPPGGK